MLPSYLLGRKNISIAGCFAQMYFYFLSGCTEFILFAVMSYDCYVAICSPLQYPVIMTSLLCVHLVILSWVGGFRLILSSLILKAQLPYCGLDVTDHLFCDSDPSSTWPVLISVSLSCWTSSALLSCSSAPSPLQWSPMFTSSPPYWRYNQAKVIPKPLPSLPPISLWSPWAMGSLYLSLSAPHKRAACTSAMFSLSSPVSSHHSWIHSFSVYEMKLWKKLWRTH